MKSNYNPQESFGQYGKRNPDCGPTGYDERYDERNYNYGPETASMDPYTLQITNRLAECEKQLMDTLIRVNRLNDKLFGPTVISSNMKEPSNLIPTPQKPIMEQIVGQANYLNRRLCDLSESISRLESL
jgi:hypothetical protein